jgi:predicted GIY-YIG superfamily endonuclease
MITVYALKNQLNSEIYVGITKDLSLRISQHNKGKNRYTKAFKPWFVYYTEEYPTYEFARCREKELKSTTVKRFLREKNFPRLKIQVPCLPANRCQLGRDSWWGYKFY